jgi:hypothetical protein
MMNDFSYNRWAHCIAVDVNGTVYLGCVDFGGSNAAIVTFDSTGTYLDTWELTSLPSFDLFTVSNLDIEVDGSNQPSIYVMCGEGFQDGDGLIYKLNQFGEVLDSWGTDAMSQPPGSMSLVANGGELVLSSSNWDSKRVYRFTTGGGFIDSWLAGEGINDIHDIDVSSSADALIVSASGNLVHYMGQSFYQDLSSGCSWGCSALGVEVSSMGDAVYVVDSSDGISVFER